MTDRADDEFALLRLTVERRVLESIEPRTWDRMAELVDPRLQKIRLRSEA